MHARAAFYIVPDRALLKSLSAHYKQMFGKIGAYRPGVPVPETNNRFPATFTRRRFRVFDATAAVSRGGDGSPRRMTINNDIMSSTNARPNPFPTGTTRDRRARTVCVRCCIRDVIFVFSVGHALRGRGPLSERRYDRYAIDYALHSPSGRPEVINARGA